MAVVYQIRVAAGWEPVTGSLWDEVRTFDRFLGLGPGQMDLGWEVPLLDWMLPGKRPDVTTIARNAVIIDGAEHPELLEWFSSSGRCEEVGGDAEGLTLVRFSDARDIGIDPSSYPKAGNPTRLSIDLPTEAVGFCGVAGALGLISIEERVSAADGSGSGGFRQWARENDVTGLDFKVIWDSEDASVVYDKSWRMTALTDRSILD